MKNIIKVHKFYRCNVTKENVDKRTGHTSEY
jgi:hypothetical protein